MQPRRLRIGLVGFPYAGNGGFSSEHPSLRHWFGRTLLAIKDDSRCDWPVWTPDFSDTPITMTRNLACREAQKAKVDVLVMFDSDQFPDLYVNASPAAKPFFQSSFDFLYTHFERGPCMIVAPYCGPPPDPVFGGEENVYVFHWELNRNDWITGQKSLKQFTRHEAAICQGFMEVAAGPTGLSMIDVRCLEAAGVPKPWFDYEWEDPPYNTRKASTEDVFFTRNLSMAGVPVYCNWDAWAGHVKPEIVGKPWRPSVAHFRDEFLKCARAAGPADERLVELGVGKDEAEVIAELNKQGAEVWIDEGLPPEKLGDLTKLSQLKPGQHIVYSSGAVVIRGGDGKEAPCPTS